MGVSVIYKLFKVFKLFESRVLYQENIVLEAMTRPALSYFNKHHTMCDQEPIDQYC